MRTFLLISLIAATIASVCHAEEKPNYEFSAGLGSGSLAGLFGPSGLTGGLNFASAHGQTVTSLGIAGGAGYRLNARWELFANPALTYLSAGGYSATLVSLTTGPMYNFSDDFANSPFVFLGPGLLAGSGTFDFKFTVAAGKRFGLTDSISYAPTVAYTGIAGGSYVSSFSIEPIRFSLLF